jgi:hypothetical protein
VTVSADGHLPTALDRLHQAVTALVDERKEQIGDAIRAAPSRYDELLDEVPSTRQRDGFASGGRFKIASDRCAENLPKSRRHVYVMVRHTTEKLF